MANKKITQLDEAVIAAADYIVFVDDPTGSPVTKRDTVQGILDLVPASGGGGFNQGFMTNGKLSVTVASNNLTVALKTLAGADPSVGDPVQIRINDVVRDVTSALSVTKNAGTNWFNSGGAETATLVVPYFVYLGYNATDGVVIGFSRISHGRQYSDFSATTTNDKYCAISTITTAASTDYYENVGYFEATLSAGAGYTWTVPTFTAVNLRNAPTYESNWMTWTPTITGYSANPTSTSYAYKVKYKELLCLMAEGGNGTSNATTKTYTAPMTSATRSNGLSNGACSAQLDNGAVVASGSLIIGSNTTTITAYRSAQAAWTASGGCRAANGAVLPYEI